MVSVAMGCCIFGGISTGIAALVGRSVGTGAVLPSGMQRWFCIIWVNTLVVPRVFVQWTTLPVSNDQLGFLAAQ